MTDNAVEVKRNKPVRAWQNEGGKQKHLGGRWSNARISEELEAHPLKWWSLDELAKLVHGATCKKYRDGIRRRIPRLRQYMLGKDDPAKPMVTRYSERGSILGIKFFVKGESAYSEENALLDNELQRLVIRKEITEERANRLRELLALPRSSNALEPPNSETT